ncbi:MAG: hypothetical protein KA419_16245 [Acidobacteria bacterium]|nr:hypothetical protein [Acidobacteriota bacterium]
MSGPLPEHFSYFSDIEDFFVTRRGKHLLISALDWTLIQTWRETGVPLHVALRGIDRAMSTFEARKGRHTLVNSLFYCHQAVMEEYETYLASRSGSPEGEETAPADDLAGPASPGAAPEAADPVITAFRLMAAYAEELDRLRAEHPEPGIGETVGRVLSRLDALKAEIVEARSADPETVERDLRRLDDILVAELEGRVPPDERRALEAACRAELKHYRKNLPKETYDKILANFTRKKLRERFGLSDLSLLST